MLGKHYESPRNRRTSNPAPLRNSAEDAVVIYGRNDHAAIVNSNTTEVLQSEHKKNVEEDQPII